MLGNLVEDMVPAGQGVKVGSLLFFSQNSINSCVLNSFRSPCEGRFLVWGSPFVKFGLFHKNCILVVSVIFPFPAKTSPALGGFQASKAWKNTERIRCLWKTSLIYATIPAVCQSFAATEQNTSSLWCRSTGSPSSESMYVYLDLPSVISVWNFCLLEGFLCERPHILHTWKI